MTWDPLAETCEQFLSKGQLVDVEGRLETRQWDDDAGKRHSITLCQHPGMGFVVTHLWGNMEADPPHSALEALYDELADADGEHTDVSVGHETGWILSAFQSGRLVLEHVDSRTAPRHRADVSREEALDLFRAVARGDLEKLEALEWSNGY